MFVIENNEFDSHLIAPRAGRVSFDEKCDIQGLGAEILKRARVLDYDFVSLAVRDNHPPLIENFILVGTIVEFVSDRDSLAAQTSRARSRYKLRAMSEDQWPEIERLLQFGGSTRFSNDPNISVAKRLEHKLAMLRRYQSVCPDLFNIAYNDGTAIGYQASTVTADHGLRFYEIAIAPEYRKGFAALNLLDAAISSHQHSYGGQRQVVTSIYEDNKASLDFFTGLGMQPMEAPTHHYHLWIKQRQEQTTGK
ncbi:MAG: hypothetical protein AAF387_19605 [Pseudomonadota bacterium]